MDVLKKARMLWDQDCGRAIIYARLHRDGLPSDLVDRVASRNTKIEDQSRRFRDARAIHDRVNVAMESLGGASTTMAVPHVAMVDHNQHLFESVMVFAAQPLPPGESLDAKSQGVMEDALRGKLSLEQFFEEILPPEHRHQVAQLTQALQMMRAMQVPQMAPMLRLMDQMPKLAGALSLPETRLADLAAEMGLAER